MKITAMTRCPFCLTLTRKDLMLDVREHEALQGDFACESCAEELDEEMREEAFAEDWNNTHHEWEERCFER